MTNIATDNTFLACHNVVCPVCCPFWQALGKNQGSFRFWYEERRFKGVDVPVQGALFDAGEGVSVCTVNGCECHDMVAGHQLANKDTCITLFSPM